LAYRLTLLLVTMLGLAACRQAAPAAGPTSAVEATDRPAGSPAPTLEPAAAGRVVTTNLASGWTRYTLPDEGAAVSLPPGWVRLSHDLLADDSPAGQDLKDLNPALADALSSDFVRATLSSGVRLFLIYTPSAAQQAPPYATNMQLFLEESDIPLSLDQLSLINVSQLETLLGQKDAVRTDRIRLGDAEAVRLRYAVNAVRTDQTVPIDFTTYLFLEDRSVYTLTFGVLSEDAVRLEPMFEDIARSLELSG
jgi:hypothetical protein